MVSSYKHSAGFTLLETIVALAILASVASAVIQLYASGIETTLDVESESQAYIYAQSIMDEALLATDIHEVAGSGAIENTDYRYEIIVSEQPYHGDGIPEIDLLHIEVLVSWGAEGYGNDVSIVSIKTQSINPVAGNPRGGLSF